MKATKNRKKIYDALVVGAELRMTSTTWKVESADRRYATLSCSSAHNPVTMSKDLIVDGILSGAFALVERGAQLPEFRKGKTQ